MRHAQWIKGYAVFRHFPKRRANIKRCERKISSGGFLGFGSVDELGSLNRVAGTAGRCSAKPVRRVVRKSLCINLLAREIGELRPNLIMAPDESRRTLVGNCESIVVECERLSPGFRPAV